MSVKINRKQRKAEARAQRQLSIQVKRVQKIEDYLIEHVDPVECPVEHYFTENTPNNLNICCREFRMPANTIVTGTIYKIEMFWILVQGSARFIEGDHTRDVVAPCLLKNVVGTKNGIYAYEDCLFYGFIPNLTNTRNVAEILDVISALPVDEIQNMGSNKQQMNYQKRLENEHV